MKLRQDEAGHRFHILKYQLSTDEEHTANALDQIATARIATGYLRNPLANFATHPLDHTMDVTSSDNANDHTWHLTQSKDDQGPEEMVFTIQGIVCHCDLPPVVRQYGRSVSPKHLRQRVTLTGHDTPTFSDAIKGLERIIKLLHYSVRDYSPQPLTSFTNGYVSLEITNRYFTSKRFANEKDCLDFNNDVDPKGILSDMRGDSFVHTPDNVVEYYHRVVTEDGEQRFKKVPPSHIKIGDIVEVQLTISLYERCTGKGKESNMQYMTKVVLRSVTLLDARYSEENMNLYKASSTRPSLKRRIGHDEEETMEAQDRMKRMAIDPLRNT
ncbi:hypothetical protein VNI00_012687 [Paramarasmius palmivorus]|uniref:Uncharacterized protein n=1 Tax=Paramarasmius palmivorus TaxID=297713 RepID=A0AAW0C5L8_9AGAR